MAINQEQWLFSLDVIKESKILIEAFEKDTKTTFNPTLIVACFKGGYLSESIINRVQSVGAMCFEINGKIFLEGDSKGNYDFVGDNMDYQPLIELFDMTTEMKNGQSYSFYVSTTSFFEKASLEDCVVVNEFLKQLP